MPRKALNWRASRLIKKGHPYLKSHTEMPSKIKKKLEKGQKIYERRFKNLGPGKLTKTTHRKR